MDRSIQSKGVPVRCSGRTKCADHLVRWTTEKAHQTLDRKQNVLDGIMGVKHRSFGKRGCNTNDTIVSRKKCRCGAYWLCPSCGDHMIAQLNTNVIPRNDRLFRDDAGTMEYAKKEYKVQLLLSQSNDRTPREHWSSRTAKNQVRSRRRRPMVTLFQAMKWTKSINAHQQLMIDGAITMFDSIVTQRFVHQHIPQMQMPTEKKRKQDKLHPVKFESYTSKWRIHQ